MDLDSLQSDFNKSVADAKQAVGNNLFSFLGTALENKAKDAGLVLKSEFVPKVDEPDIQTQAAGFVSANGGLLLAGALVVAYLIFRGKK